MADFFDSFFKLDGNGFTEIEALNTVIDAEIFEDKIKPFFFWNYMSHGQLLQLVRRLSVLSNQERRCFFYYHFLFFSFSEIADMMSISKSSVQRYIERARKNING